MIRTLKVLGVVSVGFGTIATLLCFFPLGIFFAILSGFFGMLFSTAYIFIDFRYQISTKKITPGLIGIALSSVPILLIMIHNFIGR